MSSVNQFKDTIIYGNFQNKDNYKAGGNICNATFDRSITVGLTGYFKNSIGVTGDANINGNIKGNTGFFNNGLGITGDVSLSGNLKNSTIILPSFTGFLKYQSGTSTPNIIFPNNGVNDITIVSTGNTQTLSNKTLTAPRMTTPLITSGGIGVTGNALFNNDITVSGQLSVGATGIFNSSLKLPNNQVINTTTPSLLTSNSSISDSQLSSNVCLLDATPSFTSGPKFYNGYTVYSGGVGSFLDSTNTNSTQISQYNNDCYMINYTSGGSIFINSTTVDLSASNVILKGGNNINNYTTALPFTDGINYITGQTILRGGDISISDGLLTCNNGLTVNGSVTLPNTQVINSTSPLLATTDFVNSAVSNLVNSAPLTLDTLNELASALGNDPNFATTMTNLIATKQPILTTSSSISCSNITFSNVVGTKLTYYTNYYTELQSSILRTVINGSASKIFRVGTTDIATINSSGLTLSSTRTMTTPNLTVSGTLSLPNNSISDNALSTNVCLISSLSSYVTNSSLSTTLSSYLTTATASSIYATISSLSSYVTNSSLSTTLSSYVTNSSLSTTLSSYVTNSSLSTTLSNYLTTSSASSIYATISSLSSYVTSSSLSTTLSNYLTTSSASSIYATISSLSSYVTSSSLTTTLSSYLTTASASSTYQTIAGMYAYATYSSLSTGTLTPYLEGVIIKGNIELQTNYTSYPIDSNLYLGYISTGLIYSTFFTLSTNGVYNLGTVLLGPGVWIITANAGVRNTHVSSVPVVTNTMSISATTGTIDNSCFVGDQASYNRNVNFIKQLTRTVTNTSLASVNYYLTIKCTYGTGTISFDSTTYSYSNIYAVRVG